MNVSEILCCRKYLTDSLKEFENDKVFTRATHIEKLLLINWILNTLAKNKNFKRALEYSEKLHDELLKYNKLYYEKFIWTYHQSVIVNNFFSGNLKNTIEITEELKLNPKYKGNAFYDLAIYLNLASLYYCDNKLSKSVKNLSHILTKDVFSDLAKPLKVSVSILEMILHYEKDDYEFSNMKLKEIKRKFKDILKLDEYKNEEGFLFLFKDLIKIPDPFRDKKLTDKIDQYLKYSPDIEPGSNEVINYRAWLSSKINKSDYYETVIDLVNK